MLKLVKTQFYLNNFGYRKDSKLKLTRMLYNGKIQIPTKFDGNPCKKSRDIP